MTPSLSDSDNIYMYVILLDLLHLKAFIMKCMVYITNLFCVCWRMTSFHHFRDYKFKGLWKIGNSIIAHLEGAKGARFYLFKT